ncbi:3-oxoacyl-reductase [Melanomma pulvis-pyrius CBS 109.77]|uniref:3-oxoacyl-reductase n=1 Tax=Melanomma pulvis-pyrius CBS 109.77 TaxID=1314802 RepID=A0A6A6XMI8_9PLEO|nr:3-oxoacyl-reductase [Melanomma pulvis-pyrius CBS 109.77]
MGVTPGRFTGTKVLVFGGSSGIGLGVARLILEAGCVDLALSSANATKLNGVADELRETHASANITTSVCDMKDADKLEANIEATFADFGAEEQKFDHIVFAAGDPVDLTPLAERTVHSMIHSGMVRFFAALVVAKLASKYMHVSSRSSLTITGGIISNIPLSGWTFHGAYFAALEGATKSLALELRPLRVNLVSPGPVITEAWENVPREFRNPIEDRMLARCATGAMATVKEIAEAYLYLMANSNSTGSIVVTDGGVSVMGF